MDQHIPSRPIKARPAVVDQPEPGFFKLRLHAGGWNAVPCQIAHEDGLWAAVIDGEPAGIPHEDPIHADGVIEIWHKRKTPISEAEYGFLTGPLKAWAREFYPDHPLLDPRAKVVTARLRPIPEFSAPVAPTPVSEEPLPENRPGRPVPMTPAEITTWLDYENETLVNAITNAVEVLTQDRQVTVGDDLSLARVSANVDIARAHRRQADNTRKTQKDPFLRGGQAVDKWFGRYLTAIDTAVAPVQTAMNRYGAKLDAERRAEAERQAEAARLEAERLAARAMTEMQRQTGSPVADVLLDEATEAARTAEAAQALAAGNSADLTRSHTTYGGVVSGQELWEPAVADISRVPLEYLQVNETLVRRTITAWVRTHLEEARAGISPIPGIRIERSIAMRTR